MTTFTHVVCTRESDHKGFIPLSAFTKRDLPDTAYNSSDLVKAVRWMGELTVCIRVPPTCRPGRTGSGWISHIAEHSTSEGCASSNCLDVAEGKKYKHEKCYILKVHTARHVVYSEDQIKSAEVYLFYDHSAEGESGKFPQRSITGSKLDFDALVSSDSDLDLSTLTCVTHERRIYNRVKKALQQMQNISSCLLRQSNKDGGLWRSLDTLKLGTCLGLSTTTELCMPTTEASTVVIMSHPHGFPKHVSFGKLCGNHIRRRSLHHLRDCSTGPTGRQRLRSKSVKERRYSTESLDTKIMWYLSSLHRRDGGNIGNSGFRRQAMRRTLSESNCSVSEDQLWRLRKQSTDSLQLHRSHEFEHCSSRVQSIDCLSVSGEQPSRKFRSLWKPVYDAPTCPGSSGAAVLFLPEMPNSCDDSWWNKVQRRRRKKKKIKDSERRRKANEKSLWADIVGGVGGGCNDLFHTHCSWRLTGDDSGGFYQIEGSCTESLSSEKDADLVNISVLVKFPSGAVKLCEIFFHLRKVCEEKERLLDTYGAQDLGNQSADCYRLRLVYNSADEPPQDLDDQEEILSYLDAIANAARMEYVLQPEAENPDFEAAMGINIKPG